MIDSCYYFGARLSLLVLLGCFCLMLSSVQSGPAEDDALVQAARDCNNAAVEAALAAGATPNTDAAGLGWRPIHLAAHQTSPFQRPLASDCLEVVMTLVDSGVSINTMNGVGESPVSMFSIWDAGATRSLLNVGADASVGNPIRQMMYGEIDSTEIVSLTQELIDAGALVESNPEANGAHPHVMPPLFAAVSRGVAGIGVMELLLNNGADVAAVDFFGNVVLHRIAESCAGWCEQKHVYDFVMATGGREAGLATATNNAGETALHVPSCPSIVYRLLIDGADPNTQTNIGTTPLHRHSTARGWSMRGRDVDREQILLMLLTNGADVDRKDNEGNSPLHAAIRVLLQAREVMLMEEWPGEHLVLMTNGGANLGSVNNDGKTALEDAQDANRDDIVALILRDFDPSIVAEITTPAPAEGGTQDATLGSDDSSESQNASSSASFHSTTVAIVSVVLSVFVSWALMHN